MRNVIFLLCVLMCFCNCEQKQEATPIIQKEKEVAAETTKIATVDETNFEPFDVSEYLSGYVLIGQHEAFKNEKIHKLNILGHNLYMINSQGLIAETYNISNNYFEYTYTNNGSMKSIANKQHTPALMYHFTKLNYKKDGTLQKVISTAYDKKTKQEEETIITDISELKKYTRYFKGRVNKEPFKINREKHILLTYRSDLAFCCGELMPGKNSLHYYYNENQLFDSLVINSLETDKKRVFVYEYNK